MLGQYPFQYFYKSVTPTVRTRIYKVLTQVADLLAMTDTVNSIIDWIEGQASLIVDDLTALAALDTEASWIPNGSTAYVRSVETYYEFNQSAPNVTSGQRMIAASGGTGAWLRNTSYSSIRWQSQSVWYIDAVNGDDENAGTSASVALRTFGELAQRLNGSWLPITTTVHVLSAIANTDPPRFDWLPSGSTIDVVSDTSATTVLLANIALTAVAPNNLAGNVYPTISAAAMVPNWSDYLGKAVRIVTANGGNQARVGAIAHITADLGAKTARIINFISPTTKQEYNASVGDVVEIINLPVISTEPSVTGDASSCRVSFSALWFRPDFDYDTDRGCAGYASFFGCAIFGQDGIGGVLNVKSGFVNFYNCLTYTANGGDFTEVDVWSFGQFYSFRSGFGIEGTGGDSSLFLYGTCGAYIDRTLLESGAGIAVGADAFLDIKSVAVFDNASGLGAIQLDDNSQAKIRDGVYGTGNDRPVFYIDSNVHITYLSGAQFVSTDTGGPFASPIEFKSYAQQTWANLAAGPGIAKTAAASDSQSTFTRSA